MPSKILLLSKGIEIDILIQVYVIALDKAQGVTFKGGILLIWKEKENISTNRLFFSKALMHTCIENLVHTFVRAKQVKNLLPLFGTLGKLFIFLQSMPNNAHYCACEWAQKMRSST